MCRGSSSTVIELASFSGRGYAFRPSASLRVLTCMISLWSVQAVHNKNDTSSRLKRSSESSRPACRTVHKSLEVFSGIAWDIATGLGCGISWSLDGKVLRYPGAREEEIKRRTFGRRFALPTAFCILMRASMIESQSRYDGMCIKPCFNGPVIKLADHLLDNCFALLAISCS